MQKKKTKHFKCLKILQNVSNCFEKVYYIVNVKTYEINIWGKGQVPIYIMVFLLQYIKNSFMRIR